MRCFPALSLNAPSVNNACRRPGRGSRTRAINIGGFGGEGGRKGRGERASRHEVGAVLFAIIIIRAEPAVLVSQILQQQQRSSGHKNSIGLTNNTPGLGVPLTAGADTASSRGGGRIKGGADGRSISHCLRIQTPAKC